MKFERFAREVEWLRQSRADRVQADDALLVRLRAAIAKAERG